MWQYRHTDEMYHSNTHSKNTLYHSDTYLGNEFSDGLYHYKYKRREKKNGKWVYYYNDAEYNKAKSNYKKSVSNYEKAGFNAATSSIKTDNMLKQRNNKLSSNDKAMQKQVNDTQAAYKNYYKAEKAMNKKYKKYLTTAIKTAPRRAVLKSVVAVANAVSKLGSLFKKKKKKK